MTAFRKGLVSLFVGFFIGSGVFWAPEANALLKAVTGFSGGDLPSATGFPNGSGTAPSIYWTADADGSGTGLFRRVANVISFTANGNQRAEIADAYIRGGNSVVIGWSSTALASGAADTGFARNAAGVVEVNTGTAGTMGDLKLKRLTSSQGTPPTCSSNCGTSPSVVGGDSAGIVTMGATGVPASGFVITFNGTWASAPACIVQSAKTGMVVGKMPIAVVTSTTTITVTTNGTAPATSDVYSYVCVGVA